MSSFNPVSFTVIFAKIGGIMKARTIKYFFSGTLFATAIMMSALSCAGVTSYETRNKHHLFAVQVETDYLLIDDQQNFNSPYEGCNQSKKSNQRKEVSWTGWLTNSNNSSFHFLDLLELIGV